MAVKIATWNINPVRLREASVLRLLREEDPDVLCLQQMKPPVEKLPLDGVRALDLPEGRLFSWWSSRAADWSAADKGRRLDHVWATPDLAARSGASRIARAVRGWERPSDHAPAFAELET